jgi:hypothetical protein
MRRRLVVHAPPAVGKGQLFLLYYQTTNALLGGIGLFLPPRLKEFDFGVHKGPGGVLRKGLDHRIEGFSDARHLYGLVPSIVVLIDCF